MNKKQGVTTFIIFALCAAGIAVFAFWPLNEKESQEQHRTRIIVPGVATGSDLDISFGDTGNYDDSFILKAPLEEGELSLSMVNVDLGGNGTEEQIVALHSLNNTENPVLIAFFAYDERSVSYYRLWDAPVAATIPGTVSMYTTDLLGDRSICVIISGMNEQGEHTMTIFQMKPLAKIAEIKASGSISVQESERSIAYQQGVGRGQPFAITAWGYDDKSNNMLDRLEITYTYNSSQGIYEQSKTNRIPETQVEQRRLREIMGGGYKAIEEFLNDLWYHVSPEGIVDTSQYIYFDPPKREIIFYGDETQQVFIWQNSNPTRYGLYLTSQNISVSSLRRFLDVEMAALDSIRIRVFEDVRMKIGITESWDGSYRRARAVEHTSQKKNIRTYTEEVYDSSMGRLRFRSSGEYELNSGGVMTKGIYAFFLVGGSELLELRPDVGGDSRLVYKVSSIDTANEKLSLSRVRLGSAGIHDLHEIPIILTKAQ